MLSSGVVAGWAGFFGKGRPMGKVNLVVWALCMFAVGVLGGLLFATVNRGSLGEMTEERDQLAEENAQLREQVAAVRKEAAAQLESAAGMLKKVAADVEQKQAAATSSQQDLAERLRRTTASHVKTTEYLLKSQAVLGLLLEKPETRTFLLSERFRRSFKGDWWFPEQSLKLIGGKWLLDELVAQKLIAPDALEKTSDAKAEWKQVATWTVRGTKSTEAFETVSPMWRVGWKIAGDDRAWVMISIKTADGQVVDTIMGYGADSSFVRAAPGAFYLEVNAVGAEATVAVEEPI